MLPPAILDAADRLITALMTLVEAVAPVALTGGTPAFPTHTAHILALRIVTLINSLIRISAFGIRAPANPTLPARIHPAPAAQPAQPTSTLSLPRRPGWLLAALPDIAPTTAAELSALLADPALAALLAAAPILHRALRPLLRALDLAAAQPPPSPRTPPPRIPPPDPAPHPSRRPLPSPPAAPKNRVLPQASSHAHFVTI